VTAKPKIKSKDRIVPQAPASLKPSPRNAHAHSKKQLKQIAQSIERFGFTNPVLVDENYGILAGQGRVAAAKILGMKEVPTLCLGDLSEAERKAYVLADNKIALNAGWDKELLALEMQELVDLDFEVELTGFSLAEIDYTLDAAKEADADGLDAPEDEFPGLFGDPISKRDDLWSLGYHRLLSGDAQLADDFATPMGEGKAELVFTDPPYNVQIDGNVCVKGQLKHRQFTFPLSSFEELLNSRIRLVSAGARRLALTA